MDNFVYEGMIEVIEQEGGYADPSIALSDLIVTNGVGTPHADNLGDVLDRLLPRGPWNSDPSAHVRITVEFLD